MDVVSRLRRERKLRVANAITQRWLRAKYFPSTRRKKIGPIYKENNIIVKTFIDELKAAGKERDDLPFNNACHILALCDVQKFSKRQMVALKCELKEVQDEFKEVLLQKNIQYIIGSFGAGARPWRNCGRTEEYSRYLQNRRRLEQRLRLPTASARRALSACHTLMPQHLVTLDELDSSRDVHDALEQWRELAEERADALRRGCWARDKASTDDARLLIRQIVRVQTSQMVRRTVCRLLEQLDACPPPLQINAESSSGTTPTEAEFSATIDSFITVIWDCCRGMLVEDDAQFEAQMHSQMSRILERHLSAPRAHLVDVHVRFCPLLTSESVPVKDDFDVLGERVVFLQGYLKSVLEEPPEVVHSLIVLRKEGLIRELERIAKGAIQLVVARMENLHQRDAASVCRVFREIAAQASTTPPSTARLIAAQDFLAEAQQTTLGQLETRIGRLTARMSTLMRLRFLSPQHCKLNTEALRWLAEIRPCFDISKVFFEKQRAEFELQLQQRTDQLNHKLEEAMPRLALVNNMRFLEQIEDYREETRKLRRRLLEFGEEAAWINSEEALFQFPLSTYPELDELKNCLLPVWGLLGLCQSWRTTLCKWMDGAFDELDAESIQETTNAMLKKTEETQQQFRAMIKQQIADNNPRRLKGTLDDPGNLPAPLQLCQQLLEDIKRFKAQLVLVRVLCNRCLRQRHWNEISLLLGIDVRPDAGASLRKMLKLPFTPELLGKSEVISFGATKELALLDELRQTQSEWQRITFTWVDDSERGCCLLMDTDALQATLASALLRTQAMRGSAFAKPHAAKMKAWHAQLTRATNTLTTWALVQDQWRQFAPIFECCDDAKQIMPIETQLFCKVDDTVRMLADQVKLEETRVMTLAGGPTALEALQQCVERLKLVNQGVVRYLGVKRRAFPRFFFLSNEELLTVLSAAPHLDRVAALCLSKIFEAAHGAEFDAEGRLVLVAGRENLRVRPVEAAAVEKWLVAIEAAVAAALKVEFDRTFARRKELGRTEWADESLLQLLLVAATAAWTAEVEASMRWPKKMVCLENKIEENVNLLRNYVKLETSANKRNVHSALLLCELNFQELLRHLIQSQVSAVSDFEWLSQLRFYYGKEKRLEGRLMYSTYQYGWEFLQGPHLIPILSTMRCYRALVTAHGMGTFLNLQGPACCGKSSTFMSLAAIFGRFKIAVTCSPSMSEFALLRVLQGTAGCGAWCLLDSVNQLSAEVLSVTAQHVLDLSMACENDAHSLHLQGREPVSLARPLCLLCVTSQNALPEIAPNNFKSLFRPWRMGPPALKQLVEAKLRAAAIEDAENAALQVETALRISQQRLGFRADFGVFAALQIVDLSIKENVKLDLALWRVLMPGLTSTEATIFQEVLKDTFGSTEISSHRFNLDEAILRSRSVILVGAPGSGKTSAVRRAAGDVGLEIVCPLALDAQRLFGHLANDEWHDGIVTNTVRRASKWLLFDGPLQPWWAESLHSALDDAPKLNLASGETLRVPPTVKIFFETHTMENASPSLVGRCQTFFFGEVSWRCLIDSWLEQHKESMWAKQDGTLVVDLLRWLIPPCLQFLAQFKSIISSNGMINTLTSIIAMFLHEPCQDPEAAKHVRVWLQAAVMMAGANAFNSPLSMHERDLFDEFYKNLWRSANQDFPLPECLDGKLDVTVPGEGNLLDHNFVFRFKGSWKYWPDVLRTMKLDENADVLQTSVPTMDTERLTLLMQLHVVHGRPLMLLGPRDSGKTYLLNHFALERLNKERNQAILLRLTHGATASLVQSELRNNLSRSGAGLVPAFNRERCVVLVDDVAAPIDAGPQELLRQMVDHRSLSESGASVALHGVLALAALGDAADSTPRLLRHFSVLGVGAIADESALRIFGALLGAALKRNGFASDVAAFVAAAAQATLEVVRGAGTRLRHPSRPHHHLGLGDAHRVILGCSQVLKEDADNKRALVRLWCNEVQRCLGDRLAGEDERVQLAALIEAAVKDVFKEQPATVMEQKLGFGRLLTGRYVEVDVARFEAKADESLAEMPGDAVLFPEAVDNLAKICRLLQMPRGHIMLLGPLGRGRRTISKLACQMVNYSLLEPKAGFDKWRAMLKEALRQAGANNKDTVLLVGESSLSDERFLEDAHSVLSAGDVPGLFSAEERQEITETVMLDAQGGQRTVDLAPLQVYEFFASRCRRKLHWLLCLDPDDVLFRTRLQRYSALLTQCTPIWFPEWPEEALERISHHEERPAALVTVCRRLHQAARRHVHANAATFGELLQLLDVVAAQRRERILGDRQRYLTGLEKLQLAAEQVQRIQEELTSLQPRLAEAAAETREMLAVIETETRKVSEASLLVRSDEAVANEQAAAAQELKSECETELAQAIPILEDAVAALNTLKPTDITLVKSMKNPPEPIKLVMAAVCVIRNIKPDRLNDAATGRKILDYWGPSKKVLGDISFLQQLKDFDKDNIPTTVMLKIRKEFIPHPDFRPEVVTNASSAAEGLCKWVRAMDMYDAVAKEVAPKKAKLEIAQREYAATLAVLEEKRAQVRRLEKQLAELRAQFDDANAHKRTLESEFQACERKLARAEKLIGGLSGERERWAATAASLEESLSCLEGDALLGSAAATYLGPLRAAGRALCLREWLALLAEHAVPTTPHLDVTLVLSGEMEIEAWHIGGLQRDATSTQSAVVAWRAMRPCVCVDPQRQAAAWIRAAEPRLRVTRDWDDQLLLQCQQQGLPLLVEDVEEPDVLLEPLRCLSLRQSDSGFRVYLTTRSAVGRELLNCVTLVDFTLPSEGLQEQLLGLVMAAKQPALRLARQQVVQEGAANKAALQAVEERILSTLSASQGNLLEDEAAVDVLDSSRALSVQLTQRQQEAQKTLGLIATFKQAHADLARDAAVAYSTLTWLPTLAAMYHFSHAWFLQLFSSSVKNSCKMGLSDTLTDAFLLTLCQHMGSALFRNHHLAFLLRLSLDLLSVRGDALQEEIEFLQNQNKSIEELASLSRFSVLIKLKTRLSEICPSDATEQDLEQLPQWQELTTFQKFIVRTTLHPDQLHSGVELLAVQTLQLASCELASGSLVTALQHSSSGGSPLVICMLGAGVDVSRPLFAQAEAERTRLLSVSMDDGNTEFAEAAVARAAAAGTWVCLHNCHLAGEWLQRLERTSFDDAAPAFKLWLTCPPHAKLPIGLVQSGVKVALEEVTVFREAMTEALTKQAHLLEQCEGREAPFCRLAFGMSFLYALLQGRTWNEPVSLGSTDLLLASRHLWELSRTTRRVSLQAAVCLVGDFSLLGHLSDVWNLRAAHLLLVDCINATLLSATADRGLARVGTATLLPPRVPNLAACLQRVAPLPKEAPPELLGAATAERASLWSTEAATDASLEDAFRSGSFKQQLQELLARLPKSARADTPRDKNPLDETLAWESGRSRRRIELACHCLQIMIEAMEGGFVPRSVEQDAEEIAKGAVPPLWLPAGAKSARVEEFVHLCSRLSSQVWPLRVAAAGSCLHVWLPGMERPEALFAAVMQLESRLRGVQLADIVLHLRISCDAEQTPPLRVTGLWLQGADYDRESGCLVEYNGAPKELPPVSVWANAAQSAVEDKDDCEFECPIYADEDKRRSIGSLRIPGGNAETWAKRGVLVFLKTRDCSQNQV